MLVPHSPAWTCFVWPISPIWALPQGHGAGLEYKEPPYHLAFGIPQAVMTGVADWKCPGGNPHPYIIMSFHDHDDDDDDYDYDE